VLYSSVQLLGDLLYRISGVSGKMSTETADEDDNFGTEQSHHVSHFSMVNFRQYETVFMSYSQNEIICIAVNVCNYRHTRNIEVMLDYC
jgi:hypothetical protein